VRLLGLLGHPQRKIDAGAEVSHVADFERRWLSRRRLPFSTQTEVDRHSSFKPQLQQHCSWEILMAAMHQHVSFLRVCEKQHTYNKS
jgi:hypothetical protein